MILTVLFIVNEKKLGKTNPFFIDFLKDLKL